LSNQLIEIIEKQENSSDNKIDKEQNQFIIDASEVKEETILLTIENKTKMTSISKMSFLCQNDENENNRRIKFNGGLTNIQSNQYQFFFIKLM
jgi:hypothetical protein